MSFINCNEKCKFQKDGYCTANTAKIGNSCNSYCPYKSI